jgi:hypothetical protein
MKKFFLDFFINKMLSKRTISISPSYQNAHEIGVIINDEVSIGKTDDFLNQLKYDNKNVYTIHFVKQPKDQLKDLNYFSPADFSLFGRVKSEKLEEFTNRSYDYIFVIDKEPSVYIDYTTAKSNASVNIGFFYDEGNRLADLQVKPDHGRELDDLLWYTRQLS